MSEKLTKFLVFLLISLNLSDLIFTLTVTSHGLGTEANPIMRYFLDLGPFYFSLVKIGGISFASYIFWIYRTRKMGIGGLCISVLAYSVLNLYFCYNIL